MIGAKAKFGFRYVAECYRQGKLIWREDVGNIIPDAALNAILDILIHESTQITTWYLILYEDNFTPDGDETYAVPGYTECTAYDEATRPEFVEAAAASQAITNGANPGVFTISATKTIYGFGLVGGGTDPNTKGDTAGGGTLLSVARASTNRPVVDNDIISLIGTLNAADDGV